MTALTRLLFDTVYFPRSSWEVVRWWETRRPVYNLAVGTAGVVSLGGLFVLGARPPLHELAGVVLVYGLLANLCYTAGPVVDLLARRVGGPDYAPIGPTLFRYGLVFSLGLTLLPILIGVLLAAVLLGVLFGAVRLVGWLGRTLLD